MRNIVNFKVKQLAFILLFFTVLFGCATQSQKTTSTKQADLYYSHGTTNLINKDYTSALDLLLKANKMRANDTKILNNLGMTYFFKKEYRLAEKSYKKALAADPQNSDARNNLASLYLTQGKLKNSQKHYKVILKNLIYKHQYRVLYNLGLIELKKNNINKAKDYFKKSIADKKEYCPAHYQLGVIAKNNYQFQKAHKNFRDATLLTCNKNPEPHYQQALMLIEMQKYHTARMKLFEIIDNFPTSKYSNLAELRLKKLRIDEKKTSSKKTLNNITPNF